MKFGAFFSYWTKDWTGDYKYFAKKIKNLGFDLMEVSGGDVYNMSTAQLDDLKTYTKDLGLGLTVNIGPGKEYDVASTDPAVRAKGIDFLTGIMKKMDRLDCRCIIGVMYTYWPNDFTDLDKPGIWARGVKSVAEMGKTAKEFGIDMCLEVVNRFETITMNTAAEGVQFCKEVDNPRVKLLLDTFHMNIEEDNIPNAIRTGGKYVGQLHVGEGNRRPPGKGSMPWGEIGKALRDIDFAGNVVMESFIRPGGQIAKDIKVWRDLSEGADEARLDADAKSGLELLKKNFLGA